MADDHGPTEPVRGLGLPVHGRPPLLQSETGPTGVNPLGVPGSQPTRRTNGPSVARGTLRRPRHRRQLPPGTMPQWWVGNPAPSQQWPIRRRATAGAACAPTGRGGPRGDGYRGRHHRRLPCARRHVLPHVVRIPSARERRRLVPSKRSRRGRRLGPVRRRRPPRLRAASEPRPVHIAGVQWPLRRGGTRGGGAAWVDRTTPRVWGRFTVTRRS